MWEEWPRKFSSALDTVARKTAFQAKSKNKRFTWMSPELVNLIHGHKSLYRRVSRSLRQDLEVLQQHRSVRNQANNLYRKPKNAHFQSCIENYRLSPRQLWSTINNVTDRQQRRLPPSLPLRELTDHFKVLLHAKLLLSITLAGPLREE